VLWRPERAISYAIANQAIKDRGQWRCGYSNLGKILIRFVAAKRVAATFVVVRACKTGFPFTRRHWKFYRALPD
jgi:hypothetical protein